MKYKSKIPVKIGGAFGSESMSDFVLGAGFKLVGTGHEGTLRYADLELIATSGSVLWPFFGAEDAEKGDIVTVSCYTVLRSGQLTYSELDAIQVDADNNYLASVVSGKVIGTGALFSNLATADLTLTDDDTAKVHSSWYIEGDVGSVIRCHFVPLAL